MYQVTFIRHAQSKFNAYGDTSRDVGLSEQGKESATRLNGNYDVVICSNLTCAVETLISSNIQYHSVIRSDICREVRDGNPINLLREESEDQLTETAEMVEDRVIRLKHLIRVLYDIGLNRIVIISHNGFIKYITEASLLNCQKINYTFN